MRRPVLQAASKVVQVRQERPEQADVDQNNEEPEPDPDSPVKQDTFSKKLLFNPRKSTALEKALWQWAMINNNNTIFEYIFTTQCILKFNFRLEFRQSVKSLYIINNLFQENVDFNHQIVKPKTFFG